MSNDNSISPQKQFEVLIVEDNPADVELIRYSFAGENLRTNLHIAEDGEEALDFVYLRGKFKNSPRPDIIILDLNLPRMSGREVLMLIKNDESLKSIPVIVFTSSQAEWDISESYRLSANCYVTKPITIESFSDVIQKIARFWLNTVTLPHNII